jgi:hypothetical protein
MAAEHSVETLRELGKIFLAQNILRPLRVQRYDPGTRVSYDVRGVFPARPGRLELEVEKFVGGGYAGQVYRVKILHIENPEGPILGLEAGKLYALKILIPPTRFAKGFRNLIYAVGFQGPFSLQANPDAVRAGALWQKFIRRGAKIQLGSERAVVDILATFIDPLFGSCGEISEWVDGRAWRFEVDDNLFKRFRWKPGDSNDGLGSPEYRAKRTFMARLVKLMHEMGAAELARQYEWWTLKSQPNALKRSENDADPEAGLTAVDFRAGLVLLPFLPQCPADFKLIPKGIGRGCLVQFDRGSIPKLKSFVEKRPQDFADMREALDELEEADSSYHESLPDIAHHHLRLFFSRPLWSSILDSQVKTWKIRNITDEKSTASLQKNRILTVIFILLGFLPFLGRLARKLWGRADYRRHYGKILTSLDYFRRAARARIAEALIRWHRSGRVSSERALKLAKRPLRFYAHLPLSLLPAGLHHSLTDWKYAKQKLDYIFARPLRLYFKPEAREQWLREMVAQGEQNGMLTREEATLIHSQIKEPFIQKYLKSLAIHLCLMPTTHIVALIIAFIYIRLHPALSWQQATLAAGIILGLFQVIPISPGSIARGIYTTSLILRERNFKDYNIAFYISFFKYIGYLAFPLQMAYRYPELARFMAGHWATSAVHFVPVFGERGALLEHTVFDIFYNYPLSLRRRILERNKSRMKMKPKIWPLPLVVLGGAGLLALMDFIYFKIAGWVPALGDIWWLLIWVPFFAAALAADLSGGKALSKRMMMGALSGALIGLLHALFNTSLLSFLVTGRTPSLTALQFLGRFSLQAVWKIFLFTIVAIIGAFLVENKAPKSNK